MLIKGRPQCHMVNCRWSRCKFPPVLLCLGFIWSMQQKMQLSCQISIKIYSYSWQRLSRTPLKTRALWSPLMAFIIKVSKEWHDILLYGNKVYSVYSYVKTVHIIYFRKVSVFQSIFDISVFKHHYLNRHYLHYTALQQLFCCPDLFVESKEWFLLGIITWWWMRVFWPLIDWNPKGVLNAPSHGENRFFTVWGLNSHRNRPVLTTRLLISSHLTPFYQFFNTNNTSKLVYYTELVKKQFKSHMFTQCVFKI